MDDLDSSPNTEIYDFIMYRIWHKTMRFVFVIMSDGGDLYWRFFQNSWIVQGFSGIMLLYIVAKTWAPRQVRCIDGWRWLKMGVRGEGWGREGRWISEVGEAIISESKATAMFTVRYGTVWYGNSMVCKGYGTGCEFVMRKWKGTKWNEI